MNHNIVENNGTSTLTVSFSDEGVDLNQCIQVDGDEMDVLRYLPFFERDLRHNYSQLFPVSENELGGME